MLNELERIVKSHFGVTEDLLEAGYILSDGSLIDFSGRRYAAGYVRKGDRFVPKRGPERIIGRNLDHRQLPEKVFELLGLADDYGGAGATMLAFMEKTGALRVVSGHGFSVVSFPSVEAVAAFMGKWQEYYGESRPVVIDIMGTDGRAKMSTEIEEPTTERVMDFLEDNLARQHNMGMRFEKGPKEWSPSGRIPGMPISSKFVDAYLEAALWSSTDQSDEPLDKNFTVEDFTPEAITRAIRDCNAFILKNKEILDRIGATDASNGHDFWLTRNGHGAGFWDRGYGKDGDELTASAQGDFGEANIIVGGDGKLRFL